MKPLRVVATVGVALVIVLTAGWGAMALWYQLVWGLVPWLALAAAALWLTVRGKLAGPVVFAVALVLLLVWWASIAPSDTRAWADDVAEHLGSTHDGDIVTLTNVRNFTWRSQADYDARWETRTYDLSTLSSIDLVCSYWMGPAIAHTLVTFGFEGGEHLTFSIEIRKERGESFSAVGGFFKQFEMTLIAADERDILRVRTNVRDEDVYLYRVNMPRDAMRSLFLAYLSEAEDIRRAPHWYNTATSNCTTVVYELANHVVKGLPLDYRLLVSGHLPEYLYDIHGLTPGYDFETLHRAARITERAKLEPTDFSRAVRDGIPPLPTASP